MTRIYLLHDISPFKGHLAVDTHSPERFSDIPLDVDEIRVTDAIPDALLEDALAGRLPVDENHGNDSTWGPFWTEAAPFWKRPARQGSE